MWRSPVWTPKTAECIGHGLILAELSHEFGDTIRALAGHLHHDAAMR